LTPDHMERVASSIVKAAQDTTDAARTPGGVSRRPSEAFSTGAATPRPTVPAPAAPAPVAPPQPEPEAAEPEAPQAEAGTPAGETFSWSPPAPAESADDEHDGDTPSAG